MRLMVGFLVLNCPRVDMVAVRDGSEVEGVMIVGVGRSRSRWREAGCVVAGVVGRRRTVVATARREIPARRSGAWGTDPLSGTVHASSHAARYTRADIT
jgi:hypothetical protein